MKAFIAIDSFKGSLSSLEAGQAADGGIKRVFPDAGNIILPVADGGEGTVDALVCGCGGRFRSAVVCDPLGRPVTAKYGILPDNTAVIEMAAASGLTLLSAEERDPMRTTTFGTGQLIADAIMQGCRKFIIGIGGSATNDGGAGCLQALGFGLLDKNGRQVGHGAEGVSRIERITAENVLPRLAECRFFIACDVENPLCGDRGCSAVFAPQKGADEVTVRKMDGILERFARLTKEQFSAYADMDAKGAGAAGGMGFALMYYLGAVPEKGVDMILRETGAAELMKDCDVVVTGEGRIDGQTAMGKTPSGIAQLAKKLGKPVIAFCGAAGEGAEECVGCGIDAYFPILRRPCTIESAMEKENAANALADTAEQAFRLIKAFS